MYPTCLTPENPVCVSIGRTTTHVAYATTLDDEGHQKSLKFTKKFSKGTLELQPKATSAQVLHICRPMAGIPTAEHRPVGMGVAGVQPQGGEPAPAVCRRGGATPAGRHRHVEGGVCASVWPRLQRSCNGAPAEIYAPGQPQRGLGEFQRVRTSVAGTRGPVAPGPGGRQDLNDLGGIRGGGFSVFRGIWRLPQKGCRPVATSHQNDTANWK